LESGEFRLGVSPYVDCRSAADLSSTLVNFGDTSSTSAMCAAFDLKLTSNYFPACDTACAMWTNNVTSIITSGSGGDSGYYNVTGQGICSIVLKDVNYCQQTCRQQAWDWDHVNCITNYYQEPSCSDFDSVQCFDAFGLQSQHVSPTPLSTDDDDNANDYSTGDVALFSVLSGVLGLVLGAAGFYLVMKYHGDRKHQYTQALLDDDHVLKA
jgi:hypothetical protein